jgi:PTH1 family peptidyl-tRNA hydrolase
LSERRQPRGHGSDLLATGNPSTRVVVGLGNAEQEYARTRHNAGAQAVARVAARLGLKPAPGLLPIAGTRSGLVLPNGFMNESGRPVKRAVERWRPTAQGLLIVHDDLELPLGTVQAKEGGGHAGHNGLRDVIAALGSSAFRRLRIGIGRPPGRMDPADYVLAPFRAEEAEALAAALDEAEELILAFIENRED